MLGPGVMPVLFIFFVLPITTCLFLMAKRMIEDAILTPTIDERDPVIQQKDLTYQEVKRWLSTGVPPFRANKTLLHRYLDDHPHIDNYMDVVCLLEHPYILDSESMIQSSRND